MAVITELAAEVRYMPRNTGPPTAEHLRFVEGVYERYRPLIYKFSVARSRDPSEADDAVSETLLRLFRNAGTLMGLHEKELVDYIVQTVCSVTADRARKHRSEERRLTSLDEVLAGILRVAVWDSVPHMHLLCGDCARQQQNEG